MSQSGKNQSHLVHSVEGTQRNQRSSKKLKRIQKNLRVLLDSTPDIWTPIVWGQFLFGCIIKSTYSGGLPKLKSLDLGACTVPWDANQDLELK